MIAQNAKSPWGYYALAEALEERRAYQAVVDELAPAVAEFRGKAADRSFDVAAAAAASRLRLPGARSVRQGDRDVRRAHASCRPTIRRWPLPDRGEYRREEIRRGGRASRDSGAAQHPDDLRLARLEAQALRQNGKTDQGWRCSRMPCKQHGDDPTAYVALAQVYADADRGAQAVKVLQDAQAKFPDDDVDRLRAGRGVRQAEEVRRRRSGVPAGAGARSRQRGGAELSRLHAGRARRAARRVGRAT